MKNTAIAICGSFFVVGCAHVPDATITYFPASTSIELEVTRLLACNNENVIFASQSVQAKLTHSADYQSTPYSLDLKNLNSTLANSSFSAEFLKDGRLSGVNVTQEGQGDKVAEAAFSLAKVAVPGLESGGASSPAAALCEAIRERDDKILTLNYGLVVTPGRPEDFDGDGVVDDLAGGVNVPLKVEHQPLLTKFSGNAAIIAALSVTFKEGEATVPSVVAADRTNTSIAYQIPALVDFQIEVGEEVTWRDSLPISQAGIVNWLPIATPPAFGDNKTIIELYENGAIKKLQYDAEAGTATAFSTTEEAFELIDSPSDAERAAAAEAEQKRIRAERDLLKCRTDPSEC